MAVRPNVLGDAEFDDQDPAGYRGAEVRPGGEEIWRAAGGRELHIRAFLLPPGESLCPYHYEYVEEWLLLLEGELELRTPSGRERLTAGALACFPGGPEGAHKVTTPTDSKRPARFVMFSDGREPSVAVYPDSDKIGVWVPGGADNLLIRRPQANADYYDGEVDG
ncbi:MAG TPA: cupin domain-containing protein [Solirubrobacteraceae bacterium]|nr:cupin domain-containing protein [Solirubrobacteraceae bacterium]